MRVAGDNEDHTQQQQPMRMNNQQMGMNNQPQYQQQQPMYSQPQQKESIGALLGLFIASKGGKILSAIAIIAMTLLFKFVPILASILTFGYLIIIATFNFLAGQIRLKQLIVCIIISVIICIFVVITLLCVIYS